MLKIGHRGAKGYIAENTILSFQKALELNVDAIELDVHLSLDKKVMVIHDQTIDRTTSKKGFVNNFTSDELQKLGIPTLQEVIEFINHKCIINIEIKDKNATKEVLKLIENLDLNFFQISSFDWKILELIFKENNQIYLGVLTENNLENALDFAKKIAAKSINPYYKLLTKEKVTLLQENGFQVFPWTVNNPLEIEIMKLYNVNGIISDFPDKI